MESLNSKWQKYDSSREEYVRGLCQKLKESNGLASSGPNLAQTSAAGATNLFQQEIARLNGLLEEKMIECERMDDSTRRDQERIQMLEQQVCYRLYQPSNSAVLLKRSQFLLKQEVIATFVTAKVRSRTFGHEARAVTLCCFIGSGLY